MTTWVLEVVLLASPSAAGSVLNCVQKLCQEGAENFRPSGRIDLLELLPGLMRRAACFTSGILHTKAHVPASVVGKGREDRLALLASAVLAD